MSAGKDDDASADAAADSCANGDGSGNKSRISPLTAEIRYVNSDGWRKALSSLLFFFPSVSNSGLTTSVIIFDPRGNIK